MGIEPGDPVVPDAPFQVLNGTKNYLGKGWDDRVGCAAIVEAMRQLQSVGPPESAVLCDHDPGGSWTARRAHRRRLIKADLGISLEAGITGDTAPGSP